MMKQARVISQAAAVAMLLLTGAAAPAQTQPSPPPTATSTSAAPADTHPWSEGEITRWDPRTLRVTLRHGEIKNLEMPPMTMVFRVQEANVLGDLKPGDKVRFRAEQVNGAYHVKQIEKAP